MRKSRTAIAARTGWQAKSYFGSLTPNVRSGSKADISIGLESPLNSSLREDRRVDIHLPKVPHSWRELAKEIAIIVVGVIITAELDAIRSAVETGRTRSEIARLVDGVYRESFTYDSIARDAANSTDAWSHMPPEQTQPFVLAYDVVPALNETSLRESYDWAKLRALKRSGGALSEGETGRLLDALEALRNDEGLMWLNARYLLNALQHVGQLDRHRTRVLMDNARRYYGACARDLPANFAVARPEEG
jgi:hypothetical protein